MAKTTYLFDPETCPHTELENTPPNPWKCTKCGTIMYLEAIGGSYFCSHAKTVYSTIDGLRCDIPTCNAKMKWVPALKANPGTIVQLPEPDSKLAESAQCPNCHSSIALITHERYMELLKAEDVLKNAGN